MERIVPIMMDLIASEVCGKEMDAASLSLTDDELNQLYKLSKAHDLAHLVGDALIKNDLIVNKEIKTRFQKQVLLAVYRCERINYELTRLRVTLTEAGIPFIPLKGSVMRQYYPEPWMRTSCDIDILVRECDLERTAILLVEKLSYNRRSKGSHDIGLLAGSGIRVEIHYSLIEENIIGNMDTVLQSVWENASPVADNYECILSDSMFYYYHIAHMAEHFVYGGCGVRPLLDIWILNHRIPYDTDKRNLLLQQGGLITFAFAAETLSEVWFGSAIHTDVSRRMGEYILHGGVYGTIDNFVSVQQIKQGGRIRYVFSRIWLPYDILKCYYPSLEGKRILLPIYEFRRWCKVLFGGGIKRSANELKINFSTTGKKQARTKELLMDLGIDR